MMERTIISRAAVMLAVLICGSRTAWLAEKAEVRHGLKAEIYTGRDFQKLVCERIDPNIEWLWNDGAPAEEAGVDSFSIRWKGWIRAPRAGRYKLLFSCDDGVRLWIAGQRVLNQWTIGELRLEAPSS